eukprot:UN29950
MKYTDESLKILAEQEYGHAQLQYAATKQEKELGMDRTYLWGWMWFLADAVILRMGKTVGISACGYVESSAYSVACYPPAVKYIEPYLDNAFIFHIFEEIEHDQVTVHHLKKKRRKNISFIIDILLYPLVVLLFTLWVWFSPCMVFLTQPKLIFKLDTWKQFIEYISVFFNGICFEFV